MGKNNAVKSPFQIRDWRVVSIEYVNPVISVESDATDEWELYANKNIKYDLSHHCYTGVLDVKFSVFIKQDDRKMELKGEALSFFTFDTEENEEAKNKMTLLIEKNGMAFFLGMLRNFVSSFSDVVRIHKRLILPSINLNNFVYNETMRIS